ncbi:MAG: hypothetical protein EP329_26865 [Deltaproteobacteria bacterium]|nr:MAG: hypothetical protein EP329_26865 [Deltaproteobacteria bacterium]
MSDAQTVEELEAQIAQRGSRFKQVIADIRAVLAEDLVQFFARETKRAFLSKAALSEALSDDQVKELKRRATEDGKAIAASIVEALADESLWHEVTTVPDNVRDLRAATPVWAQVTRVETALQSLLEGFGLADAEPVHYKSPSYFVKGLFMPGLAEHYWRLVHEVEELTEQRLQVETDAIKARLESRWDDA